MNHYFAPSMHTGTVIPPIELTSQHRSDINRYEKMVRNGERLSKEAMALVASYRNTATLYVWKLMLEIAASFDYEQWTKKRDEIAAQVMANRSAQ